jgi:hypothetical protein
MIPSLFSWNEYVKTPQSRQYYTTWEAVTLGLGRAPTSAEWETLRWDWDACVRIAARGCRVPHTMPGGETLFRWRDRAEVMRAA